MTGKNLVKPFIEQYDMVREYITEKERIVVGTMGPEATSSVQAAKYLCDSIGGAATYDFRLFPDFEALLEAIHRGDGIDLALVPSAYERVTDFFWDVKLENCLNFIFPTPQYGLVCRNGYQIQSDKNVTVATCHAVEHIIEELSEGMIKEDHVEKIITASTTTALQEVLKGNADLAVTNETSFNAYKQEGIHFIFHKYNAKIVWCVFRNKEKCNEVTEY